MPSQKHKKAKAVKPKKFVVKYSIIKLSNVVVIHIQLSKRDWSLPMLWKMEEMKRQDTLVLIMVWFVVG
jgi:hypothetical protein